MTLSNYGFSQKWSRIASIMCPSPSSSMWDNCNTMWDHPDSHMALGWSHMWDHTNPMRHYPEPPTGIHLWICQLLPKKVQQWQKLPSGQVSSYFNQIGSECNYHMVLHVYFSFIDDPHIRSEMRDVFGCYSGKKQI